MRRIDWKELCHTDCDVRDLEIFPESWTKRHDFFLYANQPRPCAALFLVCTDIRVTFFLSSGEAVSACQGDAVWIPAGLCYRVHVEKGNQNRINTYTLNLRLLDETGEELALSDTITVVAHYTDELPELHLRSLSDAVHRAESPTGRRNRLKIKAEFFALLDALATSATQKNGGYYPIRAGVEALQREWNRNEKIEKYAALCGIGEAYFYRCFREWSGQSPVEYRNRIRLSNAKTMLRRTDMRIGEISETIGFEDPIYFCRIFSKQFGLSPQNYRKKYTL